MIGQSQNSIDTQNNSKVAYYILNISFMAIIMAILLYSAFFKQNTHPIPALLTEKTGIIPPSKGLSASFSEIVRGNITEAKILNPHSLRIFSFFALQILLRILAIIATKKDWFPTSRIATIDISISVILFVVCFAPLIEFTLKLFSQLQQ